MSDGIQLIRVSPQHAEGVWRDLRLHLQPAVDCSSGRWRTDYVLAAIVSDRQQLWAVTSDGNVVGALTTEIVNYPERRALAIHFLGGSSFADWYEEALYGIEAFAKENGCDFVECLARHGFWKYFQTSGFNRPSVFYEKRIQQFQGESDE